MTLEIPAGVGDRDETKAIQEDIGKRLLNTAGNAVALPDLASFSMRQARAFCSPGWSSNTVTPLTCLFLAVQQLRHFRQVGHVRCRGGDGVYEARFHIHADVRLHAEVPLLALPGLVHLRIARLRRILG